MTYNAIAYICAGQGENRTEPGVSREADAAVIINYCVPVIVAGDRY